MGTPFGKLRSLMLTTTYALLFGPRLRPNIACLFVPQKHVVDRLLECGFDKVVGDFHTHWQ